MQSLYHFLFFVLNVNYKDDFEHTMTINSSESNNLFIIESIGSGKSRLSVNLTPYIQAIINHQNPNKIFKNFLEELVQGCGAILMNHFLEKALNNNSELAEVIKNSDIMNILMLNGHEIIKNTLDECLFSCLRDPSHSPIASLEMSITKDADSVQVRFEDNGKGFPENFLNKFTNDKDIYQYLTESGSHRKQSHIDDLVEFKNKLSSRSMDSFEDLTTLEDNLSQRSISPLTDTLSDESTPRSVSLSEVKGFGGRGLGLRNLIANVLTGYPIQDVIHYNKILPEQPLSSLKQNHSSIELSNSANGGASILIKVPLEPRKIVRIKQLMKLSSASMFKSPEADSNQEEELNKSILDKIAFKRSNKH